MKISKFIFTILIGQFLAGCSGHLYTVLNPDSIDGDDEIVVEGVIAYQVMDVVEVYQTMALVDKNKKIIGVAPNACIPKRSLKHTTRADYSKPYIIKYDAGLLETNTFSVTLASGVLTGVNTSSDPSESATSTAAILPFLASPNKAKSFTLGLPFCDEQNMLVGVFKAQSIRDFNEIPAE